MLLSQLEGFQGMIAGALSAEKKGIFGNVPAETTPEQLQELVASCNTQEEIHGHPVVQPWLDYVLHWAIHEAALEKSGAKQDPLFGRYLAEFYARKQDSNQGAV